MYYERAAPLFFPSSVTCIRIASELFIAEMKSEPLNCRTGGSDGAVHQLHKTAPLYVSVWELQLFGYKLSILGKAKIKYDSKLQGTDFPRRKEATHDY